MLIPIFIKDSNLPARVFVPCSVAFSWSISTCIGPSLCKPGARPRAAMASVISTRPAVQRGVERVLSLWAKAIIIIIFFNSLFFYSKFYRIQQLVIGEESSRNHQAYKERPPQHHNIILDIIRYYLRLEVLGSSLK